MVEIYVGGESLDLVETKIKYTRQISDLFDLSVMKCSYTNSFDIPKTPKNTRILQGLGLVGSTSLIPYEKTEAIVYYSGLEIIIGWLDVKETSINYKINIIDGIIDFMKAIDNKLIGRDLDLSEINHLKNISTVVNSFDNEYYRYLIADYGGRQLVDGHKINIDQLVPSVSKKYLLDKIFEFVGWSYSGSIKTNEDFVNSWMTYPSPDNEDFFEQVIETYKNPFQETGNTTIPPMSGSIFAGYRWWDNAKQWDSFTLEPDYISIEPDNWTIKINIAGQYRITLKNNATSYNYLGTQENVYIAIRYGGTTEILPTVRNEEFILETNQVLEAGDTIWIGYCVPISQNAYILYNQYTDLKIERNKGDQMSFNEKLIDFSFKDYFKEFVLNFGLTPVVDNKIKHITFLTQEEKIDRGNFIDWTKKYIRRTSESYMYGSYAQNNYFKHKYNDDNSNYADGNLTVRNQNLDSEKTLYTSKFYAREDNFFTFPLVDLFPFPIVDSYTTMVYPMYEKEPIEDEDGNITINYKPLNGRFYTLKSDLFEFNDITLKSEKTGEETEVDYATFANHLNTQYNELVSKYYPPFANVINVPKVHNISLSLNYIDIVKLDFNKLYYFEQEASYYILNRLTGTFGETEFIGEFIKI